MYMLLYTAAINSVWYGREFCAVPARSKERGIQIDYHVFISYFQGKSDEFKGWIWSECIHSRTRQVQCTLASAQTQGGSIRWRQRRGSQCSRFAQREESWVWRALQYSQQTKVSNLWAVIVCIVILRIVLIHCTTKYKHVWSCWPTSILCTYVCKFIQPRRDCEHFSIQPPEFPQLDELQTDIAKHETMWSFYEDFSNGLEKLSSEDWISFRLVLLWTVIHNGEMKSGKVHTTKISVSLSFVLLLICEVGMSFDCLLYIYYELQSPLHYYL